MIKSYTNHNTYIDKILDAWFSKRLEVLSEPKIFIPNLETVKLKMKERNIEYLQNNSISVDIAGGEHIYDFRAEGFVSELKKLLEYKFPEELNDGDIKDRFLHFYPSRQHYLNALRDKVYFPQVFLIKMAKRSESDFKPTLEFLAKRQGEIAKIIEELNPSLVDLAFKEIYYR